MQENQIKQAIETAYNRLRDNKLKMCIIDDGHTSYIAKMNDLYNMKKIIEEPTLGYCEYKTLTLLRTSILALHNIDDRAREDHNEVNPDDLWAVTENLRLLENELENEIRLNDINWENEKLLKEYLFEELSRLYSKSA